MSRSQFSFLNRFFYALLLLCNGLILSAQQGSPVKWSESIDSLGNNEYRLRLKAKIDAGWYIYSQTNESKDKLVPTTIDFKKNPRYTLVGGVDEKGNVLTGLDPELKIKVNKFAGEVEFLQKIKLKGKSARIRGEVEYMTCNDKKCNPPKKDKFKFSIGKGGDDDTEEEVVVQQDPTVSGLATEGNSALGQSGFTAANENTEGGNTGIEDPIKWSYNLVDVGNGVYELQVISKVEDHWYIYSQDNNADEGPRPTIFTFEDNKDIEWLEDKVREEDGVLIDKMDPVFKVKVKKYEHGVIFKRKLKFLQPDAVLKGSFEYMTCDDSKCLFPPPEDFAFNKNGYIQPSTDVLAASGDDPWGFKSKIKDCGLAKPMNSSEGKSNWMIFLLGALGGFAALLTPCVFPMIPLTVSFFTKRSKDRKKGLINALIYALSIIIIYVGLGFLVTKAFGPDILNWLSTNHWFNLVFFAIFTIFAFSFFGYFEITLPSWIINKSDSASEKGGLIGIFFMAFTLALVSFSCTGPIIGTLLVEAAVGGKQIGPILGMTGFAVALALPFALFALFPGWLNSLPKSGGWLNSVKVVLGFIELIFALKFLSNADLVKQWWILPRELFLAIWVILFVLMGLYLFAKIKFPHDSPIKKLSGVRKALGVLTFLMAGYITMGIFGYKISLISGFPPPEFYSYRAKWNPSEHRHTVQNLDEAIALSKSSKKPLLVDFTGWACVNCRKMEENVWPYTKELLDQYEVVSLYVDEKIPLPADQQIAYTVGNKVRIAKQVGEKWSALETSCFASNTQPYYALLTPEGELLADPVGYTPNITQYEKFLKEGIERYEQGKTLFTKD